MHGVKRLFSWMIPRFDRRASTCRCVSLRKKDLSEETLDALGIDITYLERVEVRSADAARRCCGSSTAKQIDILHLHGYGATTFGRTVGALRGHPDHRARARESDRHAVVPESRRPRARTVHRHRPRGVAEHGRLRDQGAPDSRAQDQSRLPRRAARGVQPRPIVRKRSRRRGADLGIAAGRVRGRHDHAPARLEGQLVPGGGRRARRQRAAAGPVLPGRRRAAAAGPGGAGSRARTSATVSSSPVSARDVAGDAVGVRPERVPVAVGGDADHRVRSAGDGKADCRHGCRRPARHPDRRSRRRHRAAAQRRRARDEDRLGHRQPG